MVSFKILKILKSCLINIISFSLSIRDRKIQDIRQFLCKRKHDSEMEKAWYDAWPNVIQGP